MTKVDKKRQEAILKILHFIQDGGEFETAKAMFQKEFEQVDVSEITAAERELIAQGLDPREIQYLCNVHADVFKGNIKENDDNPDFSVPGHPVHTLRLENLVIKSLINDALLPDLEKYLKGKVNVQEKIIKELKDLATIDKHYRRKETSLFPLMTKYSITAPPKVMWGVDDKIRHLINEALGLISEPNIDPKKLKEVIHQTSHEVLEMIFKEEKIMIPMIDEVANQQDWFHVKQEEAQIGYTLIQKPMNWKPKTIQKQNKAGEVSLSGLGNLMINFKEGSLKLGQLNAILDALPFALTFLDENDIVRYFGGGASIFPHSTNALGNHVLSCHMPQSEAMVKEILTNLHSGKKDKYEFWFTPKMLGKSLYLQYMAVRDQAGKYVGCLEVAQDITKINELDGEKKTIN